MLSLNNMGDGRTGGSCALPVAAWGHGAGSWGQVRAMGGRGKERLKTGAGGWSGGWCGFSGR